jgi:hypothetical protein
MNLDNLNLVELNAQEVKETDGGILLEFAIGFLVGTILAYGEDRGWWNLFS